MKRLFVSNLDAVQKEAFAVIRGGTVSGTFSASCSVCSRGFRPQDLVEDPAQANKPRRFRQKVCPHCARLRGGAQQAAAGGKTSLSVVL